MAQERSPTPEKQLLNLIENTRAENTPVQHQGTKHHISQWFSPGMWRSRLSFLKDSFKKRLDGKPLQIDFKLINKVLAVIIIITIFFLINMIYSSVDKLRKMPTLKMALHEGVRDTARLETTATVDTVAHYLDKIRQRDIFKIGAKKPAGETAPPASTPQIVELTQNLKLVGISWSNDPDVMIEDTKALRTFFVKRGQMIGPVKIEAVFKDKVILSYNGEEIELR